MVDMMLIVVVILISYAAICIAPDYVLHIGIIAALAILGFGYIGLYEKQRRRDQ